MHHTFYKQYVTYFQTIDSTVDARFMEYIEDNRHTRESGVCAWIIHYHKFWKLEYGGQKLVAWCQFLFSLFQSSKNRNAGGIPFILLQILASWHIQWCAHSLSQEHDCEVHS